MTLPNLIIAGAGRCGTTAIFRYLAEHPDVCTSARKETHYFLYRLYERPAPPLSVYRREFARFGGERIVLEASPGYLSGGRAVAEEINNVVGGGVRILIVLRDPLTRLESFYRHALSHMQIPSGMTLAAYVERCQAHPAVRETHLEESEVHEGYHGGFYGHPLQEWESVFGNRLAVKFYEDLRDDQVGFMRSLCLWLGIAPDVYGQPRPAENTSHEVRFRVPHRVAKAVGDRAEPLLNRYPRAARSVRAAYLRLNTNRASESTIESSLAAALRQEYWSSNELVRSVVANKTTTVPEWLQEPAL